MTEAFTKGLMSANDARGLLGIPIVESKSLRPDQVFMVDGRILAGSFERAWMRLACLHRLKKARAALAEVVERTEVRLFGVTRRDLPAGWAVAMLPDEWRDDLRELCRRHGIEPRTVLEAEELCTPDGPVYKHWLHFTCKILDSEGRAMIEPHSRSIGKVFRTVPLNGDLPTWWRPHV